MTYTDVPSKFVDDTLNGTTAGPLATAKVSTADWTQGNSNTGLAALGGGAALANRAAGVAAVVVHALSGQTGNDQDFAWKFDISKDQPILKRRYTVGLGDTGSRNSRFPPRARAITAPSGRGAV